MHKPVFYLTWNIPSLLRKTGCGLKSSWSSSSSTAGVHSLFVAASKAERWLFSWACQPLQLWRYTSLGRASSRPPSGWHVYLSPWKIKGQLGTHVSMTTINSKEGLNPSKCGHRGKREVGPGLEKKPRSHIEFIFIYIISDLSPIRISTGWKALVKKIGEKKKSNNTPKNAVCTPLKREVLMCYKELVIFCQWMILLILKIGILFVSIGNDLI